MGNVTALGLIYFESPEKASVSSASVNEDGFDMSFRAKAVELSRNLEMVPPLLARARLIHDLEEPPTSRDGCTDCERLAQIQRAINGVFGLGIIVLAIVEGRVLHGKVAGGVTLFIGLAFALYGFGGWNVISAMGALMFSWGISQKPIGFSGGILIFLGAVFLLGAFEGDGGLNHPASESNPTVTTPTR